MMSRLYGLMDQGFASATTLFVLLLSDMWFSDDVVTVAVIGLAGGQLIFEIVNAIVRINVMRSLGRYTEEGYRASGSYTRRG